MNNEQSHKLRRIIGGMSAGLMTGIAFIPIVACGEEEKVADQTVDVTEVNIEGVEVVAQAGVNYLPTAPTNTYWEYAYKDMAPQKTVPDPANWQKGDQFTINLVAEDGYQLSKPVKSELTVKGLVKTPADYKETVKDIEITTTGVENLPTAPANTHWEYKVETGPFSPVAPTNLKEQQTVVLLLVADENYSFYNDAPTSIVREVADKVIVPDSLKEDLKQAFAQPDTIANLPPAPPGAKWEFSVNGEDKWTDENPDDLEANDQVSVKLAPLPGFDLGDEVVETDHPLTVDALIKISDDFLQSVMDLKISEQTTLTDLPKAPAGSHWEFKVDGGEFDANFPSSLIAGTSMAIRLQADATFNLEKAVQNDKILITGEITIDPALETALDKIEAHANGIIDLPEAPAGTQWEFTINGGASTTAVPQMLNPGDKVNIFLVAQEGFTLAKSVSKTLTTTDLIGIPEQLTTDLQNTQISTNGITNLPTAPTHTHWEYKQNDGAYSNTLPTNLQMGDNIAIRLRTDTNYVMDATLERTGIVVSGFINVDPDVTTNLAAVNVKDTGITGLPAAPDNSHWEYMLNDDAATSEQPSNLKNGDELKIMLVPDGGYLLSDPVMITKTVTSDIEIPTTMADDLNNVVIKSTGIENLPVAPENSHWEYKINNGSYSENAPQIYSPGQKISIRLVAETNYKLSMQIEREMIMVGGIITVDEALTTALDSVEAHANGLKNLPTAPENSHWTFKIGDEAATNTPPTSLNPGDKVVINLEANDNFELTKELTKTVAATSTINIDDSLRAELEKAIVSTNGIDNLAPAPAHTHWEYKINDGAYSKQVPSNLRSSDKISIRLETDTNYTFTGEIERVDIDVLQYLVIDPAISSKLMGVKINDVSGISNLPAAPSNSHWEYKVDDGAYSNTKPTSFSTDQVIAIKLVADDRYLLSTDIERTDIAVTGTVNVPANLDTDLDQTTVDADSGIMNLPTAPTNSHWEYKVDDGAFSATEPTTFTIGQKISFKLTADPNYVLNGSAERTDVVVSGTVNVPANLDTDLAQTTVDADGGIMNLPAAPANSHWEYKVDDGAFSATTPTTFSAGQKISFKLMADPNYVLNGNAERMDVVVSGTVNVPANLDTDLDQTTVDADGGIMNLPAAPANSHWEYKVDDGAFSATAPTTFSAGQKISFKLMADPNYVLNGNAERMDVVVSGTVNVPANLDADLDQTTVDADGGIMNLPAAPTNSHWEYKVDDGTFSATAPTSFTAGQKISFKLMADPNFVLNGNAERMDVVVNGKVNVPASVTNNMGQVTVNADSGVMNLPTAPANSHWEYKVDDGSYDSLVPPGFTPGEKVSFKLVADPNYVLSSHVERSDVVVTGTVNVPSNIINGLGDIVITENGGIDNLLPEPQNSHWEYKVDDGSWTATEPTTFIVGQKISFKLVAETNYVLSSHVERSDVLVTGEVTVPANVSSGLAQTTVDTANGITDLPASPANSHWEYKANNGSYSATVPTTFTAGENISFKLVADQNYVLDSHVERTNVPVTQTVNVPPSVSADLAQTTVDAANGIVNLPTAPENSHWEYKVDSGTYSATVPTTFTAGENISFKLAADQNYVLDSHVERTNVVVA